MGSHMFLMISPLIVYHAPHRVLPVCFSHFACVHINISLPFFLVLIDDFSNAARYTTANLNALGFRTEDGGMLADTIDAGRLRLTAPATGGSWWYTNLSPNTGVPSACFNATSFPNLTITYSGPAGGSFSAEVQIHGPLCDSTIARRITIPLTTDGTVRTTSVDIRTLGVTATELTRIKSIALIAFAPGGGVFFIDSLSLTAATCSGTAPPVSSTTSATTTTAVTTSSSVTTTTTSTPVACTTGTVHYLPHFA
ncbi:hypothetical protein BKA69DRAFT_411233 [Paraphysoderma sedebokerense]|nr:hypothetical protein BKA69DRAFT_411233 [Paraphysoderma sedebokerense]